MVISETARSGASFTKVKLISERSGLEHTTPLVELLLLGLHPLHHLKSIAHRAERTGVSLADAK